MRTCLIGFMVLLLAITFCSCQKAAESAPEPTPEPVVEEVKESAKDAPDEVKEELAPAGDIAWAQELFGEKLIRRDKSEVSINELLGKKRIAVYFSAHWCPPCRSFTPKLVEAYDKLKADGKPFELVFASGDRTEEAMSDYMNAEKMEWLAIPFESPLRQKLGGTFGVRGIPTLIILDDKGKVLTKDARSHVMSSGAAAFDQW